MSHSPWNVCIDELHDGIVVRVGQPAIHLCDMNADAYKTALYDLSERVRRCEVRLDFGNVHSVSSVILGVLLTFRRKLHDRGATLTLINVRPEVHEIFDVTRLSSVFMPQAQVAVKSPELFVA